MADHSPARSLHRAELARRTGCNLETIRYYEKIGMLPDPPRSAAGYRLYDARHVDRLRFILRARELGFAIADIRGLLDLVDGGTQTCALVKERTERHLVDVRAKIADLERIAAVLAATAAECSGDKVPNCPILDTLSHQLVRDGADCVTPSACPGGSRPTARSFRPDPSSPLWAFRKNKRPDASGPGRPARPQ